MKAVTWQGKRDVRVEAVPDPTIEEPNDAVVRISSTGLCVFDLHLLGPFMEKGDSLGHEPVGIIEAVVPKAYERFQRKEAGTFRVVFEP